MSNSLSSQHLKTAKSRSSVIATKSLGSLSEGIHTWIPTIILGLGFLPGRVTFLCAHH